MDRAEERCHRQEAVGLPALRGLGCRQGDNSLYGASRLFVNFFQPSFKLASKHRDSAKVTKRYHLPLTPSDRLLQDEGIPSETRDKLRETSGQLDPLKLLKEIRAVQAYLTSLADGETPPAMTAESPNLATFVARLSSAWRDGEVRPTFSLSAKPRYLRTVYTKTISGAPSSVNRWREDARERAVSVGTKTYRVFNDKWTGRQRNIFAEHWIEMVECLDEHPDQTALELLVEFHVRYPGRYGQRQLHTLQKRVRAWRQQAVQRLINEVSRTPNHAAVEACR